MFGVLMLLISVLNVGLMALRFLKVLERYLLLHFRPLSQALAPALASVSP